MQTWDYLVVAEDSTYAEQAGGVPLRVHSGGWIIADAAGTRRLERAVPLVQLLNLLGAQGWELVAVQDNERTGTYLFKRPVPLDS